MEEKISQSTLKEKLYELAKHNGTILFEEFRKETDRGAVIFVGSLIDVNLELLLKKYCVQIINGKDELFNGAMAPLSSLSAKIEMAYRLGLISKNFKRDLHIIRKIRNDFAHDLFGCSFKNKKVQSRIRELEKSCGTIENNTELRESFPEKEGARGDFLLIASWMIFAISMETNKSDSIKERQLEFGYNIDEEK